MKEKIRPAAYQEKAAKGFMQNLGGGGCYIQAATAVAAACAVQGAMLPMQHAYAGETISTTREVSRGESISGAVIASGGRVTVSGTAEDITVMSGGEMSGAGAFSGITLSGGEFSPAYGSAIMDAVGGFGIMSLNRKAWNVIAEKGTLTLDAPDAAITTLTIQSGGNVNISEGKILNTTGCVIKDVAPDKPVIAGEKNGDSGYRGTFQTYSVDVTDFSVSGGSVTSGTLIAVGTLSQGDFGSGKVTLISNSASVTLGPNQDDKKEASFAGGAASTTSATDVLTLTGVPTNTFTYTSYTEGNYVIDYNITQSLTGATFSGTIPWQKDSTYYTNSGGTFTDATELNLNNLNLDFTSATTAEALSSGAVMTLIGGGNVSGTLVQSDEASFNASYAGGNATYTASLTGAGELTSGNLVYKLGGAKVNSISINANITNQQDSLPNGWQAGYDAINVDTSNLVEPTGGKGGEVWNLFYMDGAMFNLTGSHIYNETGTAYENTMNGVALVGTQNAGGVRSVEGETGRTVQYVFPNTTVSKLTFGNVEWKTEGALINGADYPQVTFNGAAVDTTNIHFTNLQQLAANQTMTLVSGFGETVGTITGTKYTVGTALEGEGSASLTNGNLIFTTTTAAQTEEPQQEEPQQEEPQQEEPQQEEPKTDDDNARNDDKNTKPSQEGGTAENPNGGKAKNNGVSENNKLTLTNVAVTGDVFGGSSEKGVSQKNTANVEGGTVSGSVYGGKSDSGAVSESNVNLSGDVAVENNVYGGYSEQGTADKNTVTVKQANIKGYLYGGKSKENSADNAVNFENGTVIGIVGGGCDVSTGNTVTFDTGTVEEHVFGGFADTTATKNTVTISGGTVKGGVYGGYAGKTADSNTITLTGGTILGQSTTAASTLGKAIAGGIYGGYSETSLTNGGTTRNNTVNLYGTADISATSLYGGNLEATGNVLNIGFNDGSIRTAWTGGSQSVKNIGNFDTLNFVSVPWSTSTAAVTITDGTATDLSGTKVSADGVYFTNVLALSANDKMTMLDMTAVSDSSKKVQAANVNTKETSYAVGTATQGKGQLSLDSAGNVIYTVTKGSDGTPALSVQKQTHNTLMSMEAGIAALSAGNEFIEKTMGGLADAANMGPDGVAVFAAMGGGSGRYKTGSSLKTNTWNGTIGVGTKRTLSKGTVEWGGFVEHGRAKFTIDNSEANYGSGSSTYTGGGLLGKWTNKQNVYVEGSFRMGRLHDRANNILRAGGVSYGYNERADYWGAHLGIGKIYRLGAGRELDVYGKFFLLHREGVSFNVLMDKYTLDAVNSHVLRLGARYTQTTSSKWKWYGGLAYEYEFSGESTGTAAGNHIRSADIGGGSFMAEFGWKMDATADNPWKVNIGVTGFAGQHKGVSGNIGVAYMF